MLFHQIVAAIKHLHTYGIVHRDIKLENILIVDNEIKLCDLAFAAHFISEKKSQMNIKLGTPGYIAPEMFLKG
jgi:serine/threonine protein kinase